MHRDFDRDDPRRRYRRDDDPRDDPRERYGNEEDQWSREYRRAYAESDLPRRMHDDRPYNRPGYEPEFGRPGGRENVDPDRGRRGGGDPYGFDWEQPADRRRDEPGYRGRPETWQGGYYGQGRRFSGQPFEREGHGGWGGHGDAERGGQFDRGGRQQRYQQPSYSPPPSPYDQGDVSTWYGGDTGMGDPGSSGYGGSWGSGSPSGGRQQDRYGDARPGSSGTSTASGTPGRDAGSTVGSPAARVASAGAARAATGARTIASVRKSASC